MTGGFCVGAVYGTLGLDTSDWKKKLGLVHGDMKGLTGQANAVSEAFASIGKKMVLAGAAAITTLGLIVKQTADAGDAINDMSQRTGIATDILSGYKLAAEKAGSSLEDFAIGMQALSSRMFDVKSGAAGSKKAFDSLGVSVTDSNGKLRPLNDVMLDVADRFSRMEDGAEKAALAQDIFSRSGRRLIPLLNQGAAGLKEEAAMASRLGLVFDKITAAAADRFNDSMTNLKGSITGIRNDIGNALIPVFTKLADGVTEAIATIRGKIAEFVKSGKLQEWAVGAARVFIGAFKLMAESVAGLMLLLPSLKASIFSVAEGFYGILSRIADGISLVPGVSAQAGVALKVMAGDLKDFAATYGKAADDNKNKVSEIRTAAGVLLTALDMVAAGFGKMGIIAKKTFKEMATASKITGEEMAANLSKLVGTLEAAAALEPIDIPIEFNFFPADEPLDTSFYKDLLDMGAELSAEATRKIKEKAIDPLAKAFDGLYNDIATGFGDALEGMFDGTKRFGDAFVAIWQSIKKAFFRVIGEMVAKFMVGFVQKILKGMSIIKAFESALGVGGTLLNAAGKVAAGTVVNVAGGAVGETMTATSAAGGAAVKGAAGAAAGISAAWVIGVAFAAVWLGAVFGRLFGKTAADKWEEEFNKRMKAKYGPTWTNPPSVITLEQLKQINPPPPPIDYPGRKKPGGGTVTHPGSSGDINVTLHVSTLDSENVVKVVRDKVIPVLREAARRHEFWIPLGSAGGV